VYTVRTCTDEVLDEGGAAGDAPTEPGLWNNRALEICRQNAAGKEAAFDKRLEKLAQVWLTGVGRRARGVEDYDPYCREDSRCNCIQVRSAASHCICLFLWSPYGIGQNIIFSCCSLFFLSFFFFLQRAAMLAYFLQCFDTVNWVI